MKKVFDISTAMGEQHDEFSCLFCREVMKPSSFYPSSSKNSLSRMDRNGMYRMPICKSCCQKLYDYLYATHKSLDKALFRFCATFDVYYDENFTKDVAMADIPNIISVYYKRYGLDKKTAKTFLDSSIFVKPARGDKKSSDEGLDEEDKKNLRDILANFHDDPFEKEPIEDRKKLYRSLVTMIDPAMSDDLVRQRAAIEIVRTFARIDKWTDAINEMSADPQTMLQNSKDIKILIDAKTKETDMVTKFSKDHGFAERYAMAKSKGTGTLSATIRDMEEFHYDDGRVNLFDIQTSASMQQAADITTEAIIKQLALSEADYVQMLKQQREEVVKLNQEVTRLKEENRLIYKQITKQELLKELAIDLKKKGLAKEEITALVAAEIKTEE